MKTLTCGTIVYTGSVYVLPKHYLKQFERAILKFLWSTNVEPLNRTVCYHFKEKGVLILLILMLNYSLTLSIKFCKPLS